MKKFIAFIFCGITFACIANAESININWIVDGETHTTTTCNIGDNLILPTAPTKYGYTFQGWAPCTPIEYIESTGAQYIDTGIIPSNYNYSAEFRMSAPNWGKLFFGMGTSISNVWGGEGYQFGIAGSGGNSSWGGATASTTASLLQVSNNVFYNYKMNKNGFYVNGVLKSAISNPIDYAASKSIYIGRSNNPGADEYTGSSKWSWVKIYNDNNTLVRDFIPVLDPDGVPCMYDRVTGTFFYNSGTGDFIAGPVIE